MTGAPGTASYQHPPTAAPSASRADVFSTAKQAVGDGHDTAAILPAVAPMRFGIRWVCRTVERHQLVDPAAPLLTRHTLPVLAEHPDGRVLPVRSRLHRGRISSAALERAQLVNPANPQPKRRNERQPEQRVVPIDNCPAPPLEATPTQLANESRWRSAGTAPARRSTNQAPLSQRPKRESLQRLGLTTGDAYLQVTASLTSGKAPRQP
jgi:hypothetical protein